MINKSEIKILKNFTTYVRALSSKKLVSLSFTLILDYKSLLLEAGRCSTCFTHHDGLREIFRNSHTMEHRVKVTRSLGESLRPRILKRDGRLTFKYSGLKM